MSKLIGKYGIRFEAERSVRNALWYNFLMVNGMGLKRMALGLGIKGNTQNIKAVRLARLVFYWMWYSIDFQVSNWSTVSTKVLGPASWIFNLCSHMGSYMQKGPILGLMLYSCVLKSLITLSKVLIFIPHWSPLNYSAGSEGYYSPGCGIDEENEFYSHEKKKWQVQIWFFTRLWALC